MEDKLPKDLSIETSVEKYVIQDGDRKNIKLIGFNDSLCCWATKGFETTNKLIFQLWQNEKTMDSAGEYGHKERQSTYCTHAKSHWNSYSDGNPDYEQFWFLKKIPNVEYKTGDLTDKQVVQIFIKMKGTGPDTICAMDDTYGDLCGDNDQPIGNTDFKEAVDKHPKYFNGMGKECIDVFNKFIFKNQEYKDIEGFKLKTSDFVLSSEKKTIQIEQPKDTKLDGHFICSNTKITSLSGAPSEVGGNFNCSVNPIKSLEGAPKVVGRGFYCSNTLITSLKHSPSEVGEDFYCSYTQITSLKYAPSKVGRDFDCSHTNITSLEGAPSEVGWDFDCHNTKINSLKGAPVEGIGNFDCSNTLITSLEGAPREVGGDFKCYATNISSLEHAPSVVGNRFDCSNTQITSLYGVPSVVGGTFDCSDTPISSLNGAPVEVYGWFYCTNTNLTQKQIEDYKEFLKNPTKDLMDETGHYKPKEDQINEYMEIWKNEFRKLYN